MIPISRILPHAARMLVAVATLSVLLVLSGCMTPAATTASSSLPRPTRAAPAFSTPAAVASRVQTQPLYQQAVAECRGKRYKHAADLLLRLAAQPGLSAQEAAFVQQQSVICLQDAHLPVPPAFHAPTVPTSVPASTSALHGVTQASDADCGPRALLLLCRHEGVTADLPRLRQLAGTTKDGTSLEGLEKAAKTVGLRAEGVQVSREALGEVEMPALAYVNGNHFIAVLSVQGQGENAIATVHDPNVTQEQTIPQERLLRLCSGYLLLAHK